MDALSRNNKIINEIIANNAAAILLTKSDGASIGFLSELGNFYRTVFWFSAIYDNCHSFAIELAEKILGRENETFKKLLQLKHCNFEYNKDNIILNMVLNHIAKLSGDCLLVIDNVERIKFKFKYTLLELLLKNAPKNLKIVLVSETFIDINYGTFEGNCPKLYDYHTLESEQNVNLSCIENENFTTEQLAFLCYLSRMEHVEKNFALSLYEGSEELFGFLNIRYKNLMFSKGADNYYINPDLYNYLLENHPEIMQERFFEMELLRRIFDYKMEKGHYIHALRIAHVTNHPVLVDKAVKKTLEEGVYLFQMDEYCADAENYMADLSGCGNNLGLKLFFTSCDYQNGFYRAVIERADDALPYCEQNSALESEFLYLKCSSMVNLGKSKETLEIIREKMSDNLFVSERHNAVVMEKILCMLPDVIFKSDSVINNVNMKMLEKVLFQEGSTQQYWYAKALQSFAEVYFHCGNYNKAIENINAIRVHLPFYVIPYKLMDFYYYIGDMKYAHDTALTALKDSASYNIDADLTDVYILLAKTSMYFNNQSESLSYIENAVKCPSINDREKYFSIAVRSIILAKTGRAEYGKDIAMIYAKYCELNSVKMVYFLYGAIAYCCWKQGDKVQAQYYAKKCLSNSNLRSGVWLLASAISLSILLEEGELRDAKTLVEKLLNSGASYGMITVVVDYVDCFAEIMKYAKEHKIKLDYIAEIERMLELKLCSGTTESRIVVKMMGVTSVLCGGREIQWKTKKAKELFLLYLWQGERGLDRSFIINTLWGDYVYVSALNNLKTTNNIIRNTLADNNVNFKLEYGNSKYKLHITNIDLDYKRILKELETYSENEDYAKQTEKFIQLFELYNGGFALDINQSYFRKNAETLRDRLLLNGVKLVRDLLESGDIIEAKRIYHSVHTLDAKNEYGALSAELDSRLRRFYEL